MFGHIFKQPAVNRTRPQNYVTTVLRHFASAADGAVASSNQLYFRSEGGQVSLVGIPSIGSLQVVVRNGNANVRAA